MLNKIKLYLTERIQNFKMLWRTRAAIKWMLLAFFLGATFGGALKKRPDTGQEWVIHVKWMTRRRSPLF
jgi:hypothetical protein